MSKELPYFKFMCDEWLTGDITLEDFDAQGLFISVCAYYWKKDCSITMAKLRRRYSCAIATAWQVLLDSNCLKVGENDEISISFLDEQWKERADDRASKSEAGKKGADKRWQSYSTPIKVPMAKHGNKDKEKERDKDTNVLFDQFWLKYPSKVGKGAAVSAFSKIKNPAETIGLILTALEWQVVSQKWTEKDGQYIPHPSTYLNQQRWLDEPKQSQRDLPREFYG